MAVGGASLEFNPVPGVRLGSVACGIKADDVQDLVLFEFAEGSTTAGVFTQSHFAAAPVDVAKAHLAKTASRYFLINSGNANAATGKPGIVDAENCCKALSQQAGGIPEAVIPFSTGVIGERLQVENITTALPEVIEQLDENNWLEAARGIMTTDTRPKISTRQVQTENGVVTITGIAKGAGMIQPNMATMLAYVATDGLADLDYLQRLLGTTVEESFNRITVDSDTSTNDACMLTATGVSGIELADIEDVFLPALQEVMLELAHGIIRDAEGATKFVAVEVCGGKDSATCLSVAYAIANSPLMKTALYASDANWGRIVMAIGKADAEVDPFKVDVFINDVQLMSQGGRHSDYEEEQGAAVMAEEELTIRVVLGDSEESETVWTSDLSHDYVSINADYRT